MFLTKYVHLTNTSLLGFIILMMASVSVFAGKIAVQSDGMIVVVGSGWNGTNPDISVWRFDAYGNPDMSFGTRGRVLTNIGVSGESGEGVVIQADGKIVVGGWTTTYTSTGAIRHDFAVLRYNPNGTLDPTFDGDGIVVTNFASYSSFGLAVAYNYIDQKIIVSGTVHYADGENDFATIRYNPNGSPDSSFGFFGRKVTAAAGAIVASAVATDTLGRVYVGGRDSVIARYNYNGSDDATFDYDGIYNTAEPFGAMELDSRSRVVGATRYTYGSRNYFKVFRLDSAGALDPTFGFGGVKISVPDGVPESMAIQPDQRITVAGRSGRSNLALARYNYNGTQDNTFGSSGIVIEPMPAGIGAIRVESMAHYRFGSKTLVLVNGRNGDALIRYRSDGSRDNLFSGDGVVILTF